jgi:hypothetical protein
MNGSLPPLMPTDALRKMEDAFAVDVDQLLAGGNLLDEIAADSRSTARYARWALYAGVGTLAATFCILALTIVLVLR